MMLFQMIVVLLFTMALIQAVPLPQKGGEPIKIISQSSDSQPDGAYVWSFESANSIKAEEKGSVKQTGDPENPSVVVAQGSYSYTDPDGQHISVVYTADDQGGFRPEGAHFPTPPPIPAAIQKALDFIASHPSTPERLGKR